MGEVYNTEEVVAKNIQNDPKNKDPAVIRMGQPPSSASPVIVVGNPPPPPPPVSPPPVTPSLTPVIVPPVVQQVSTRLMTLVPETLFALPNILLVTGTPLTEK